MKLIDLPPELIEETLTFCDPIDVSQAAQTCTALRCIVYLSGDSKLWRELYLCQFLDDPRTCISQDGRPRPQPIQWKSELQRIIRARTVVTAGNYSEILKQGELKDILETFLMLITNVPPYSRMYSEQSSKNLAWTTAMLEPRFLDWAEGSGKRSFIEKQLASRIHAYYGLTKNDLHAQSRVNSRAFVYSLKNYRPEREYGPFLETGETNWEHIQAIHHVMSRHLVDLGENQEHIDFTIFPMSMPFIQSDIPEDINLEEENDWAAVGGPWTVSFCFCDHRDLLRFNEASVHTLDTSLFEDDHFREEFRSLSANLTVTRTEPDPDHPNRPKIFFFGEMQEPSNSTMNGYVKMTKDNQIQWHFVSGDQGTGIWSSEGIQVGGVRSSYGVLGTWTTVFHDEDDPVGPFWLQKQRKDDPGLPQS